MRHVSDISALWESQPPTDAEQTRVAARALLDPPVFAALEAVGYRTRVIRAPIAHVPIGGAQIDDTIDTASNFELDLPQRSVLSGLLELVAFAGNQQRSHVEESLAAFADPPTEPTFTLAHLLSPHAPFVFAADGSPAPPPPCYPATCSIFASEIALLGWSESEHWSRLIGQIEHINDLVLSAVDSITERDPDAVIVLLSDHGIRRGGEEGMIFDNLLVARTPGHERLLGTAPTTINILPAVFNAYLGTRIPPLADTTYTSGVNPWLEVVPYRPSR